MSRLKTGQANSQKQQNHISALLGSVYQVLQDVRNTPVSTHLLPISSHANAIILVKCSFTVADIIVSMVCSLPPTAVLQLSGGP
jgi:hypothetical protein